MRKNFQDWGIKNRLKIQESKYDNVFLIEEVGKFYLLDNKQTIIDKNFDLVLTEQEKISIRKHNIEFVVFEFGDCFYYAKVDLTLESKEGNFYIPTELNEFRYVGKAEKRLGWKFSHLGIHDEYELLNGIHKAKKWCKKAKFLEHKTLAIVDKNTLAGILAFQIGCTESGIKSILGETIVVCDEEDEKITYELKLYVKDEIGWKNLLKINKIINIDREGFIVEEELLSHSKGLILVFAKDSILNNKEIEESRQIIKKYKKYFEDVYYQIDTVSYETLEFEQRHLLAIKKYLNNFSDLVEPVLINDTYYLEPEECFVKQTLNKVDKHSRPFSKNEHYKDVDESIENIQQYCNPDKVFKNGLNYVELFDLMVKNTNKIAKLCDYNVKIGGQNLPKFEYDGDKVELFRYLLERGWKDKIEDKIEKDKIEEYEERMKYESELIINADFVDYFLILWDLLLWCKNSNIMYGTGRGSVAGSLVAYLINITEVDPIKYDLLFSRFMNETRFSEERRKLADAMPDVDLDLASERKDEVKQYIAEKYGQNFVASVGTYTRMKLKGILKDFARVNTDFSPSTMNFLTKGIDDQMDYKFDDLFKYALNNGELRKFIQGNKKLVEELKYALGQAKTPSVHASAVLIVPKKDEKGNDINIYEWMPVRKVFDKTTNKDVLVSEWEGKYVERAGFLKEDILGLSQLDKFTMILKMIKKNRSKHIVLEEIPLDDENVYKIFQKGFNEDVFQFQTNGMKKYCKFIKPDNIEELIAMTALYRPGPMSANAHTLFGQIKQGEVEPEYDYGLKEITKKTFGLYVYQEQIMRAMVVLGGLSETQADTIRTNIKHFEKTKMKTFEEQFTKGAIKRGCPKEDVKGIWEKLLAFGGYGFNRSHSVAYTIMSYYCQWFKHHYPEEFYTTSLNYSKSDDIPGVINEIRKRDLDLTLNPPDINNSRKKFTCDIKTKTIYWSFVSIKGIGESISTKILLERKNGKYKSLSNFLERMKGKGCGKDKIETLILSGAFDNLYGIKEEYERKELVEELYTINKETISPEKEELFSKKYNFVRIQKDLTGFGIIDFPKMIKGIDKKFASLFVSSDDFMELEKYSKACIAGELISIVKRQPKNKKKKEFATIKILSNYGVIPVVVWSEAWGKHKEQLEDIKKKKTLFAILGKAKFDDYNGQNTLYSDENLTKIIEL